MFSCLFYNAWVTAAALLAAACRMLNMRGKAPKWMEFATALGRLLFDPTLKPEPPPEMAGLSSFEALLNICKSLHDHRPVMLGDPLSTLILRDLTFEWGDPSCDVSRTPILDRWMQLPSDNFLTAKGVIK